MTMPVPVRSLLRRFLLPAIVLGTAAFLLYAPPAPAPPRFAAQVTSDTSSGSSPGDGDASSDASSSDTSFPALSSVSSVSFVSSVASSIPAAVASFPSSPSGGVVTVEPDLCSTVKPDPATGLKLVYCCLDEVAVYRKEASSEELGAFLQKLAELQRMGGNDAKAVFEGPYAGGIHAQYGWTTLCGERIACESCSEGEFCGNGTVDAGEECDTGPLNSDNIADACRADCTNPRCGDGVIDRNKGEACDDGARNGDKPNTCRTGCTLPRCGDGVIDTLQGETCDAGAANSDTEPNRCRLHCRMAGCGDGVIDGQEQCDDGNERGGDGCSAACRNENASSEPPLPPSSLPNLLCGNGILEPGEECDDGTRNAELPDACRPDCRLPFCGDGVKDDAEACDPSAVGAEGCSFDCRIVPPFSLSNLCGDGAVDPGEECDGGAGNARIPDHCRPDCRLPFCGDGVRDGGEECDDGNRSDDDGCRVDCVRTFALAPAAGLPSSASGAHIIGFPEQASSFSWGFAPPSSLPFGASATGTSTLPAAPAYTTITIDFPPPQLLGSAPVALYSLPPAVAPQQPLQPTGPAGLSIIAMGAAAGLAWARRKRSRYFVIS